MGKRRGYERSDLMLHRNLEEPSLVRVWEFVLERPLFADSKKHTLISLIHDPNAVIILEDDAGNPYR